MGRTSKVFAYGPAKEAVTGEQLSGTCRAGLLDCLLTSVRNRVFYSLGGGHLPCCKVARVASCCISTKKPGFNPTLRRPHIAGLQGLTKARVASCCISTEEPGFNPTTRGICGMCRATGLDEGSCATYNT